MTKEKKRKLVFWIVIAGSMLTLMGNKNFWELVGAYRQKFDTEKNLKKLDEEKITLQKQIYSFEHDDFAIEKVAREELGLTKPGEIEFRIIKKETK